MPLGQIQVARFRAAPAVRFGSVLGKQQQIEIDLDTSSARTALERWKINIAAFGKEFTAWADARALRLKRLESAYTPLRTGALQAVKMSAEHSGGRHHYNVAFMPDYAVWLQYNLWGPPIGNKYRPRTAQKFAKLGTPIGPFYATRALKAFEQETNKEIARGFLQVKDPASLGLGIKVIRS